MELKALNKKKVIKVLIVDDSALVRKLLTNVLNADPEIEVVGTAVDAYMAREKIKRLDPDVITLDVEMPKMDGITFLSNLMRLRPMPVVMVSTLTEKGAQVTLDALTYGAVDYVCKPKIDFSNTIDDYAETLVEKIKIASKARVRPFKGSKASVSSLISPGSVQEKYSIDHVLPGNFRHRQIKTTDKLIAIGASTGGTEAIREVLEKFPIDVPGIVITQHIPVSFSKPFADRVNARCAITVTEAKDGEIIVPGHAYIAPGDRHLMVVRDGARWRCRLSDDVPVNRHKPSVDVLFRSVAHSAGLNAIGIILTGMGKDGAQGLKDMLSAGAHTIAQDEPSSVVWGMPGAAVEVGACKEVLPLHKVSDRVIDYLSVKD